MTPDVFTAMGTKLIAGRRFTDDDRIEMERVVGSFSLTSARDTRAGRPASLPLCRLCAVWNGHDQSAQPLHNLGLLHAYM